MVEDAPDRTSYPMTGQFDEVVAPERLLFTCWGNCDASGNARIEVINSITLTEQNGKTKLTLHRLVKRATPEAAGPLAGMEQGWSESPERLDELESSSRGSER